MLTKEIVRRTVSFVMRYDFKKLKDAREERLLTQTDVARLAGLSVTTVNQVEAGKAPWKKAIRKIAAVLKVQDVVLSRVGGRRTV